MTFILPCKGKYANNVGNEAKLLYYIEQAKLSCATGVAFSTSQVESSMAFKVAFTASFNLIILYSRSLTGSDSDR